VSGDGALVCSPGRPAKRGKVFATDDEHQRKLTDPRAPGEPTGRSYLIDAVPRPSPPWSLPSCPTAAASSSSSDGQAVCVRVSTGWPLTLRRAEKRVTGLTDSNERVISSDVEMSFIRGRYEADFAAALREAMSQLEPGQRMLLQFRYRQEMTRTCVSCGWRDQAGERACASYWIVTVKDISSLPYASQLPACTTLYMCHCSLR